MGKDKISWIERVKGFGILAVVLGHIATPLTNFIFSWHMPLFFFLSGYLLNRNDLKESVKTDFRRLMVPYFIFGTIAIVVEFLKRQLWPNFEYIYSTFSIKDEIVSLLLWMDAGKIHTYGFVLWFLPALFWSKNLAILIKKFIKSDLVILLIGAGLWFLMANRKEIWCFGIDKAMMATTWIILGLLAKKYLNKSWILILALFLIKMPELNMAFKIAIEPVGSLIYALAIILVLIFIFRKVELNILNSIGMNSMLIFALHPYTNNFAYILIGKFWLAEFVVSMVVLFIIIGIRNVIKKTKYASIVNWI